MSAAERLRFADAPVEDGVESDRLGVCHALLERGERAAVEQVGGMHRVTGSTQPIGERNDPLG